MAHTWAMLNSPDAMVATIPLIATKLTVPRRRPDLISRRRLIERLNLGIERKLTLVSAPAGFGKTTVLAEWLAALQALDRRIAWVSLDRRDNDPTRFWDYILAALQASGSAAGNRARAMLHTAQSPIEAVLAALVNDLGAEAHPTALILDDLHAIEDEAIHQAVAYLLDHLPTHLHLVVASRVDPPLPLAGLRARGESTELRAADLKFTLDEAVAFLNEAMRLKLSMADVAALEQRTEGWIAGLQLAALSMQGRDDSGAFIAAFAGDDRYIVDYLVEEVLQRQPAEVRQFLLETSILDRLNGPLCDAVTGRSDGRAMLERLERTNLFVVPLDDKRHWYRYHHLFADVLRVHVTGGEPERLPGLHQRAATWFERQGDVPEAIEHARAAVDHETVARLLAAHVDEFERTGHFASLMSWVASLPDELVRARPKLALIHAACSVRTDPNLVVARERLSWAETAIGHIESGNTISGTDELAGLKGELLALQLQVRRDLTPDEMLESASRALDLLPANKDHLRGMLRVNHAGLRMDRRDPGDTLAWFEQAIEEVRRGDDPLTLSCLLEMRG
ncbi:MAG: AAA family ATPase, partial [Thermomicrobiales bacterium]|nr:AAA family ATPase [Thermomicrobiales bacterium]